MNRCILTFLIVIAAAMAAPALAQDIELQRGPGCGAASGRIDIPSPGQDDQCEKSPGLTGLLATGEARAVANEIEGMRRGEKRVLARMHVIPPPVASRALDQPDPMEGCGEGKSWASNSRLLQIGRKGGSDFVGTVEVTLMRRGCDRTGRVAVGFESRLNPNGGAGFIVVTRYARVPGSAEPRDLLIR